MINKIKIKPALCSLFSLILCLGTSYEMMAQKQQLTQQQMQANRQVMESQKYKSYYSFNAVKPTPFKNYEQLIVHKNGYITTLEPRQVTAKKEAGGYTLINPIQRIVRYDMKGNKIWQDVLSGHKWFKILQASDMGNLIVVREAKTGEESVISAIYDSTGNKILEKYNKSHEFLIPSPSGKYFYIENNRKIEIYSKYEGQLDFPFERLLSIDTTQYQYRHEFRFFGDDILAVNLSEYKGKKGAILSEKPLTRSKLYVISITDREVLFTYHKKNNNLDLNQRTLGISLNSIQIVSDYIYFYVTGSGNYGGFFGYNMKTKNQIFHKSKGDYPTLVSENNKYFLWRGSVKNDPFTYTITEISSQTAIKNFKVDRPAMAMSFNMSKNNNFIFRYRLPGNPPISATNALLFLNMGLEKQDFELFGWFHSKNLGYTTDGTQYYRIKSQGD